MKILKLIKSLFILAVSSVASGVGPKVDTAKEIEYDNITLTWGTSGIQIKDTGVDTAQLKDNCITAAKIGEGGIVPIGSIIMWAKTLTGCPALPSGFVECNGQTLTDADSPFNGEVIPNINGSNQFLRANSTSGGTGGAATIDIAHTHSSTVGSSGKYGMDADSVLVGATGAINTNSKLSSTQAILPPYYNIVAIMRVK